MIGNNQLGEVSQPYLFCYLLEAQLCSPFYLIFPQPVLFIFCSCRQTIRLQWLQKRKQMEKAITPRIPGAGAQGYSSSYLDAALVLQWSELYFFLLSCFHYLKRAEKTSIPVTLQMLTHDTSTFLQQMHNQQFCCTIILSTTCTKASAKVFIRVFVKYVENPPSITQMFHH